MCVSVSFVRLTLRSGSQDKTAIADADPDVVNAAGGMHLVTSIVSTMQELLTTHPAMFSSPNLFFGEEV